MLNTQNMERAGRMKNSSVKLSPRLAAVVGYIPRGSVMADIGTDHAYLPVYLVESGVCPGAVAADLNPGPYRAALESVVRAGLADLIAVRRGNGLQCLEPGEVQVVVMAGMGGGTMRRLLEAAPGVLAALERLVLQPMDDAPQLRRWLIDHGWRLADERLVEDDGHLYLVLAAEPGAEIIADDLALLLGPRILERNDPMLVGYLDSIIEQHRRVLKGLARSPRREVREKEAVVEARLKELEGVLEKCRQKQN